MKEEKVFLVPYDSKWPKKFEKEKKLLEKTIGTFITGGVHHVGSTAIPGMMAKPIVDIMVGVKSLQDSRPCIKILEKINYLYYPYKPRQEHWFCKPTVSKREFHLHMIPVDNPEFKAKIAFRDYLTTNKDIAKEYENLKKDLAEKHEDDREAYTEAKAEFVKTIVEQALKIS